MTGPAPSDQRDRQDRRRLLAFGFAAAPVIYLVLTLVLGLKSVGLENDEALLQHGAVHMLNSAAEPPYLHDRGSWILLFGRHWPLAVIPYVGAVKDYCLLLPFALFGPTAEVARAVNALLGAFGIWGIAKLLRAAISPAVAVTAGLVLAVHPSYLDQTLYDNGTVVVWMAILGLISTTLCYYWNRRSAFSALLIGLSVGIGVWNRVNFLWFLASATVAAVVVFRKNLLIPIYHVGAMICGALIGVFPMLLFQIRSNWLILDFMTKRGPSATPGSLLRGRLQLISSTLIADSEQRGIWQAPPLPSWQPWFFSILLVAALIACLTLKAKDDERAAAWRRASALTLLLFAGLMLTSTLNIAEHHLVALVPIAVVVVILAFQAMMHRWKGGGVVAVSVGLIYLASALYCDVSAARGLRRTGGSNAWSDAIFSVNNRLAADYPGREIKILDWGLCNNLYVLSNGKVNTSELYWGATRETSGHGALWGDLIAKGGVYLTNARGNMHFPEPTEGFLEALEASGQQFTRIEFSQKWGGAYAQLIEIAPSPTYLGVLPRSTAVGALFADPNPIVVCDGSGSGTTTVFWTTEDGRKVEVRVGSPEGALFASGTGSGSWDTGPWVLDGTVFYLQDASADRPLAQESTIASITVTLTKAGCP